MVGGLGGARVAELVMLTGIEGLRATLD